MARRIHGHGDIGFVLPITPMLDFTFQLLFFFMIYYNPSALEGKIEMSLPAPTETSSENPPTQNNQDEVPSLPADLTVVLRTQNDGSNTGLISAITVKSRSGETTLPSVDALQAYLKENKGNLDNKDDIKIEADSRMKWASVVAVMDVCKKEGFRIGFGAPPDLTVSQ